MKVKVLEGFYCVALGGKCKKGAVIELPKTLPGKDAKQTEDINKKRVEKLVEAKQVELVK